MRNKLYNISNGVNYCHHSLEKTCSKCDHGERTNVVLHFYIFFVIVVTSFLLWIRRCALVANLKELQSLMTHHGR